MISLNSVLDASLLMKCRHISRLSRIRTRQLVSFLTVLCIFLLLPTGSRSQSPASTPLQPQSIHLKNKSAFSLNLPPNLKISVAAQGLHRIRFIAKSPDGRLFATDMYSLADNNRGAIYILGTFDEHSGKFAAVTPYLQNLHNPNSIAFYSDPNGQDWLYVALTEKLIRYKFSRGEIAPSSEPQTLATYPAYGLSYKYGGWHLTRSIAFGRDAAGHDRLFVTVGSSCNACLEKEQIRATLSVMDPDGQNARIIARGLRNAVGLQFVGDVLYATNMGADHLGNDAPDDTLFAFTPKQLASNSPLNYGWPYCYFQDAKVHDDPGFPPPTPDLKCSTVPSVFATFHAHGSPLGLQYFGSDSPNSLKNHFLVALHGSGRQELARGFRVVSVDDSGRSQDFITGFWDRGKVHGRPCGIFKLSPDSFLITDDLAGTIYYVRPK